MAGFFFVTRQTIAQAGAIAEQAEFQLSYSPFSASQDYLPATEVNAPPLRPMRRISIPYGFDTPLPILGAARQDVVASGHGGCTEGEEVTVAITVTQAMSTAVATGENIHACTGELQTWRSVVTAVTPITFTNGAAQACGFATARDGEGGVTDTFEWCKDVDLMLLEQQTYLPLITQP